MADDQFEQGFARRTVDTGTRRERRPPAESTTLVTGATGFIGPHVVRALLDSGRRVVGLDVRGFQPEGRFILGDDLDEVPLEIGSVADTARLNDVIRRHRPNEIVHMGMIIDPGYLATNRTTGIQVNILGTVNVLEAMLAFDVDRVVNFSSIGVLPSVEYQPIDVNHPIVLAAKGPGTDFYGSSKAASELLCFAYHQALGVDFRTIRPSAVYGLGMTVWVGPIKALVEGAVRGEPQHIEFGGPHPRDYTHAMDIAEPRRCGPRSAGRRRSDLLRRDGAAPRDDHRSGRARARARARSRRLDRRRALGGREARRCAPRAALDRQREGTARLGADLRLDP